MVLALSSCVGFGEQSDRLILTDGVGPVSECDGYGDRWELSCEVPGQSSLAELQVILGVAGQLAEERQVGLSDAGFGKFDAEPEREGINGVIAWVCPVPQFTPAGAEGSHC